MRALASSRGLLTIDTIDDDDGQKMAKPVMKVYG